MSKEQGRQVSNIPTASSNNQNNFNTQVTQSGEDFGITPKWSREAIGRAIFGVLNNTVKLETLPPDIQLVWFVAQHDGRTERDSEVAHLRGVIDDLLAECDELRQKLEPQFAYKKWLKTKNKDHGFYFDDLFPGGIK